MINKKGLRGSSSESGRDSAETHAYDYLIGKSIEILGQSGQQADLNGKIAEIVAVSASGHSATVRLDLRSDDLVLNKESFVILDTLTPIEIAHLFAKESLVKLTGLKDGMAKANGRFGVVSGFKEDRVAVELDDNFTNYNILPSNLIRSIDPDAQTRLSFSPETRVIARGLSGGQANLNHREGKVARRFNSGTQTVGVVFENDKVIVLPVKNLYAVNKEQEKANADARFPLGSRVSVSEGYGFKAGSQGTVHSDMDAKTRKMKIVMDADRKTYDISIDGLHKPASSKWFANAPGNHDPVRFPFGTKVVISGLRSMKELNGKEGIVVSAVEGNSVSVYVEDVDRTESLPLKNLAVSD